MSSVGADEVCDEKIHVRRKCGCVKNIQEIKELLKRFPTVTSCQTTPKTPNSSPALRDEECELDNVSHLTQKTIPCDLACEKLFKDKSQWIFHGNYDGTCHSSDKASVTPCPPEIKNQWMHYGQKRPTPTVMERSCDGYKYNPQPQPDKFECVYASNYKSEKSAPRQMEAKVSPKYAKGPQPYDRCPEDLDAVKYRDLDKDQLMNHCLYCEGKHREETCIRPWHVQSTNPHWASVVDCGPYPRGGLSPNSESKRFTKIMVNMLQFIQFLLTFIAILIYYCIFCYMHLVYFTLRSAVYFHQADAAMKTTIAVVTVTSLVIALNVVMKFERLVGMA